MLGPTVDGDLLTGMSPRILAGSWLGADAAGVLDGRGGAVEPGSRVMLLGQGLWEWKWREEVTGGWGEQGTW